MKRKRSLVLGDMEGHDEGRGGLSSKARKNLEEELLEKEPSRRCREPGLRILILEHSGSPFQKKEE